MYSSFSDLQKMADEDIQNALREIETTTLSMAMQDAPVEIKEAVLRNMSKRAAELIEEDIANIGPLQDKDIDCARNQILEIMNKI